MSSPGAPIGVFDSGIGGLTVVREILSLLPAEGVLYLGDTARVPYGIRSPETVMRYAREGTQFLLSKGIKLLVIACNTMSAVALEDVADASTVPVLGVISPGAKAAAQSTRNGKVGVIGTEATVQSGAYRSQIRASNGEVEVFSAPCPLFVPLVEEGWLEGDVPVLAARRYLEGFAEKGIDTLVLGCTHYPLLKPVISAVMGEGVKLIDSAMETALKVKEDLEGRGLLNGGGGVPVRRFFVTDSPGKFRTVGERFLGTAIENIERVQLEVH